MTERIERLLESVRKKEHSRYRKRVKFSDSDLLKNLPDYKRVSIRLAEMLEKEEPVILEEQKIVFLRTVENLPEVYTEKEWEEIRNTHFIHEQGRVCNLSCSYGRIIAKGLEAERERCKRSLANADEKEEKWLCCVMDSIDCVLKLTERYRQEALRKGKQDIAEILEKVPSKGAETFREALQAFRILHFTLWCEGEYHNTIGRFDQYMYPYLKRDLEEGRIGETEAMELLEEFFISFNLDNDLYPGIQQGDNGQSLMLGGMDRDGNAVFNRLSAMCLEASEKLRLIDPKINLRVDARTPPEVYERATCLTRAGLGFPQYSNDDVVIRGLVKKGYALEDARDYTVAACWEFIIPGVGMDIPNIGAINFPLLVNETVKQELKDCRDYESFYQRFQKRLREVCRETNRKIHDLYIIPAPFHSLLMDGCIEKMQDISKGGKYNNFGFHGVGISTAVDSLAVIEKCVYEEKSLSAEQAVMLLESEKEETDEIMNRLRYEEPKFGDGDERTNRIASRLLADFADAVEGLINERGGCIRAGTGSAMFYLWHADSVGNTLGGHRRGEAFSTNYAPQLFVKSKGPLSVVQSMTFPDLARTINGGPLTMEFHSTVFRNEEGMKKVAGLVRQFILHGGHQLQLNAVNRETLLEAQKNPEQYRNLIVRIWGWSAYFVELDRDFQNHVISRQEFMV